MTVLRRSRTPLRNTYFWQAKEQDAVAAHEESPSVWTYFHTLPALDPEIAQG